MSGKKADQGTNFQGAAMPNRIEAIKQRAAELANRGNKVAAAVRRGKGSYEYNLWYSSCLPFVEANLRSRLAELRLLHEGDKNSDGVVDHLTRCPADFRLYGD